MSLPIACRYKLIGVVVKPATVSLAVNCLWIACQSENLLNDSAVVAGQPLTVPLVVDHENLVHDFVGYQRQQQGIDDFISSAGRASTPLGADAHHAGRKPDAALQGGIHIRIHIGTRCNIDAHDLISRQAQKELAELGVACLTDHDQASARKITQKSVQVAYELSWSVRSQVARLTQADVELVLALSVVNVAKEGVILFSRRVVLFSCWLTRLLRGWRCLKGLSVNPFG